MSTIREQIVAAAVTAISSGTPPGVPAPVRTRIDSPSTDQLPALTVYQASETVEPMQDMRLGRGSRGPVVRRSLLLNVEVLTKAGEGEEPDKAADPILAWVAEALAVADDFDGLADETADEVGTKFEYEQAESSFCRAVMTFRIQFATLANDPQKTR